MPAIPTLRALSRQAVAAALAGLPADETFLLIDATAGNGHDTLFLTQLSAPFPAAAVHAFDVQPKALTRAAERLANTGFSACLEVAPEGLACQSSPNPRCFLHLRGHETAARSLAAFYEPEPVPRARAIMFNLGFLPAADRRLTTAAATTAAAITSFLPLMPSGGIMSLHMYAGHPGGAEETKAAIALIETLPESEWSAALYFCLNKRRNRETLALVERRHR